MAWYDYWNNIYLVNKFVYHRWIEPLVNPPTAPTVDRRFESPKVAEGTPVPIVYGRCRVRSPILVWSGNYLVPPNNLGNHYAVDMLFAIGIPFFEGLGGFADTEAGGQVSRSIWAGDVPLEVASPPVNGAKSFTAFGEDVEPTSFTITGAFFPGGVSQNPNTITAGNSASTFLDGVQPGPGLSTALASAVLRSGSDIPGLPHWRGYMMAWMHVALGTSPSIPNLSFEVSVLSRNSFVDNSRADMGQSLANDADPAAVIYDLIISPWGKLGIPESRLDRASFEAASLTLFEEQHGYSRVFDQQEDALTMIGDVLRQIDGVLFVEPTTGKLTLKLVREDHNIDDLEDVNPDNSVLASYAVQGWQETFNLVRLKWKNRADNYNDAIARGQNGANVLSQEGRIRPFDIDMPGCCTPVLAQRLTSRELSVRSRPSVKATVVTDRRFHATRPGDVVTFTWPKLGISRMVMRVARGDLGGLHDGKITLDLIRDVFDRRVGAFPVL
jgi:hypothetical protein